MDPQISFFNNFFIKNGSHDTIHTFKNYFTTMFSVLIFNFSKNKINPNGSNKKHPHYLIMAVRKWKKAFKCLMFSPHILLVR